MLVNPSRTTFKKNNTIFLMQCLAIIEEVSIVIDSNILIDLSKSGLLYWTSPRWC